MWWRLGPGEGEVTNQKGRQGKRLGIRGVEVRGGDVDAFPGLSIRFRTCLSLWPPLGLALSGEPPGPFAELVLLPLQGGNLPPPSV